MPKFATVGCVLALLSLAGCKTTQEREAMRMRTDQNRCTAYGFSPGSNA